MPQIDCFAQCIHYRYSWFIFIIIVFRILFIDLLLICIQFGNKASCTHERVSEVSHVKHNQKNRGINRHSRLSGIDRLRDGKRRNDWRRRGWKHGGRNRVPEPKLSTCVQ